MSSLKWKAAPSWKPTEVLQMVNTNKHSETQWTCPVQSLKKKRCLVARDANAYIGARFLLNEMSIEDPANFLDKQDKLVELAKLTLCMSTHLNGYRKIPGRKERVSCVELAVAEWRALISNYISQENERFQRTNICAFAPNLTSNHQAPSVTSEASSFPSAQCHNQHGGRTEIQSSSIKLETPDSPRVPRESPTQRLHTRQALRLSSQAGASTQSESDSDQMAALLQAFRALAVDKDRIEAENFQLQEGKEALQQELVRGARDCQAIEEHRDSLADQVDSLYEEINGLREKLDIEDN